MKTTRGIQAAAALLLVLVATPAWAQDGTGRAQGTEAAGVVAEAAVDDEAADRAYVKGVLGRDEVRRAADIAGADLDGALARVDGLEGATLERATQQARLIDRALGDAREGSITITTTAIIIGLLVLIILLIAL